jgi:hypothetical protein
MFFLCQLCSHGVVMVAVLVCCCCPYHSPTYALVLGVVSAAWHPVVLTKRHPLQVQGDAVAQGATAFCMPASCTAHAALLRCNQHQHSPPPPSFCGVVGVSIAIPPPPLLPPRPVAQVVMAPSVACWSRWWSATAWRGGSPWWGRCHMTGRGSSW